MFIKVLCKPLALQTLCLSAFLNWVPKEGKAVALQLIHRERNGSFLLALSRCALGHRQGSSQPCWVPGSAGEMDARCKGDRVWWVCPQECLSHAQGDADP